ATRTAPDHRGQHRAPVPRGHAGRRQRTDRYRPDPVCDHTRGEHARSLGRGPAQRVLWSELMATMTTLRAPRGPRRPPSPRGEQIGARRVLPPYVPAAVLAVSATTATVVLAVTSSVSIPALVALAAAIHLVVVTMVSG